MAELAFPYTLVTRVLDGRLGLAVALGFPEVARLAATRDGLRAALDRNVVKLVEALPLADLHRRHPAAPPTVEAVTLPLAATPDATWREPVPLRLDVLRWAHGNVEIALAPLLDVLVAAADADELADALPRELRAALARAGPLTLRRLTELARVGRVLVEPRTVAVRLKTAKARGREARQASDDAPPVLAQIGDDLTRNPGTPVYEAQDDVERLAERLTARPPRSVLLVGPAGVGKTAAVRALARRRGDFALGATPFVATTGARLVAGMSGFGMWQERCQQVIREAAKAKAVVHLGNLVELMEVGKSEHNATGIAGFLKPALARGELLAVAECTPEQIPVIERDDPHLLDVFDRLDVPEPTPERGREILRSAAQEARAALSSDALATLDRLHRRYATYSAYPGRPLRFLRDLLRDHREPRPVTTADVYAAFGRETGLPLALLDPAAPLDLAAARDWFAGRVVDQLEAVDLVVELLATAKAGLGRPRKPIASLLFIGPTGVGKTELAKALAEYLFGSASRLTRFDMSEYGDPVAVRRLVGGAAGGEGALTAAVRERPFSVVLLDEFEKGHPQFLDLLLQVLGEGRLTDAAGRLADFSNSVVVMTSNLGAESYRKGAFGFASLPSPGFAGEGPGVRENAEPSPPAPLPQSRERGEIAKDHFTREVQAYLRPELFNRIDRVVPFAPLGPATVARIAERHLQRLAKRDGVAYRGATLDVGPGVAAKLAEVGFDARYGARPLIRAIERELLAPLADAMNGHAADVPLRAEVAVGGAALAVRVRPRTDASGRPLAAAAAGTAVAEVVGRCVGLRRQAQALDAGGDVRAFVNELAALEREQTAFERKQAKYHRRAARSGAAAAGPAPRVTSADAERQTRLAHLRELDARRAAFTAAAVALEDAALLRLYAETGPGRDELAGRLAESEREFGELLLAFYARRFPNADLATLALFGEPRDAVLELARAYRDALAARPARVAVVCYLPVTGAKAAKVDEGEEPVWRDDVLSVRAPGGPWRAVLRRTLAADPAAFFADPPERLLGVALGVGGPAAYPLLAPEVGWHVVRGPRYAQPAAVRIEVAAEDLIGYLPPPGVERRGPAGGKKDARRDYDERKGVVTDSVAGRVDWGSRPLAAVVGELLDAGLRRNALDVLEP